jgi:hypothetical protein
MQQRSQDVGVGLGSPSKTDFFKLLHVASSSAAGVGSSSAQQLLRQQDNTDGTWAQRGPAKDAKEDQSNSSLDKSCPRCHCHLVESPLSLRESIWLCPRSMVSNRFLPSLVPKNDGERIASLYLASIFEAAPR